MIFVCNSLQQVTCAQKQSPMSRQLLHDMKTCDRHFPNHLFWTPQYSEAKHTLPRSWGRPHFPNNREVTCEFLSAWRTRFGAVLQTDLCNVQESFTARSCWVQGPPTQELTQLLNDSTKFPSLELQLVRENNRRNRIRDEGVKGKCKCEIPQQFHPAN